MYKKSNIFLKVFGGFIIFIYFCSTNFSAIHNKDFGPL